MVRASVVSVSTETRGMTRAHIHRLLFALVQCLCKTTRICIHTHKCTCIHSCTHRENYCSGLTEPSKPSSMPFQFLLGRLALKPTREGKFFPLARTLPSKRNEMYTHASPLLPLVACARAICIANHSRHAKSCEGIAMTLEADAMSPDSVVAVPVPVSVSSVVA